MTDYKPGTVAVATVCGVPDVRVARRGERWITLDPIHIKGRAIHSDRDLADVRPLAVVDPEGNPAEIANRLSEAAGRQLVVLDPLDIPHAAEFDGGVRDIADTTVKRKRNDATVAVLDWLADQIEQQTRPPRPPEPTGLGAVVEDANGMRWTRTRNQDHGLNWRSELLGFWKSFDDIDAVKVLSEGVQP